MIILLSGSLSIHFNSSRLQVDNVLFHHIHIFVFVKRSSTSFALGAVL